MSASVWAVALLTALAAAVLLLPARRERPVPPVPGRGARTRARRAGHDGTGETTGRRRSGQGPDIGLLLTEVATLLRAGSTPQRAWHRVLDRVGVTDPDRCGPVPDGVPARLMALAHPPPRSWIPRRTRGRWVWRPAWPATVTRERGTVAAVRGAVAACRLTAALGAPLAGVLEAVASGVAESGRAGARRRAALAGPRSSARILAALPPAGLALGALVGARPLDFLLGGGVGTVCLVAGLALMTAGQWGTRRLVARAERELDVIDPALVLDLAAAALGAGASLPGALSALGEALEEPELGVVGRALLLGATWDEAWRAPEAPWCAPERLERCLRPGWEDGASPAPLLRASAEAVRQGRQAADEESAGRLAVRLVLPLGLCHLPAFVLLGVVPVVVSLGLGMLAA